MAPVAGVASPGAVPCCHLLPRQASKSWAGLLFGVGPAEATILILAAVVVLFLAGRVLGGLSRQGRRQIHLGGSRSRVEH